MLIDNKEADKRLNSPLNLINRLRSSNGRPSSNKAMELFGVKRNTNVTAEVVQQVKFTNPFAASKLEAAAIVESTEIATVDDNQPTIEIEGVEHRLKLELAHQAALETLVLTTQRLQQQITTLDSPTKLADIAAKMSRVVDSLAERKEEKDEKEQVVHYHFYMPEQNKMEQYEVIEVN